METQIPPQLLVQSWGVARTAWVQQVREASSPRLVAAALLELEAVLLREAFVQRWLLAPFEQETRALIAARENIRLEAKCTVGKSRTPISAARKQEEAAKKNRTPKVDFDARRQKAELSKVSRPDG